MDLTLRTSSDKLKFETQLVGQGTKVAVDWSTCLGEVGWRANELSIRRVVKSLKFAINCLGKNDTVSCGSKIVTTSVSR